MPLGAAGGVVQVAGSPRRKPVAGFTLIELLVVVAIIGLLISVLLPSLSRARAQADSVKCRSNLRYIGLGLVIYNNENQDYNVPSYNLPWAPGASTNFKGGPDQPLEGWASILDRDRLVPSKEQSTNTIFYCPKTLDVEGVKDGQTGTDPDKPKGWTDWPLKFTTVSGDSSPKVAVTIPDRGFNKIIRVSYWINGYNPIGSQPSDIEASDQHYTASVGLGPDTRGKFVPLHRMTARRPSSFVVVSDGIYMGRQAVTHLGDTNSRIGYRHPGMKPAVPSANVAFADGHVDGIQGDRFPRALSSGDSAQLIAEKKQENFTVASIYSDPEKVFP